MGNRLSRRSSYHVEHIGQRGWHECEILGRDPEGAGSKARWRDCKKNRGHKKFISVEDFIDGRMPGPNNDRQRDWLRACAGLTVRIRVQWTSEERPANDQLSECRGTDQLRLGTGFIYQVYGPESDDPSRPTCGVFPGESGKTQWTLSVLTAHHVVYNTEEAKRTRVDLFYDDETCLQNGKMKTVWAVGVEQCDPDKDVCHVVCVFRDESLAERIKTLCQHRQFDEPQAASPLQRYLSDDWSLAERIQSTDGLHRFNEYPSSLRLYLSDPQGEWRHRGGCFSTLVISHPHGQPKKISVGKVLLDRSCDDTMVRYDAATCPGSSGAIVLHISEDRFSGDFSGYIPLNGTIHSGNTKKMPSVFSRKQVNYGSCHWFFYFKI